MKKLSLERPFAVQVTVTARKAGKRGSQHVGSFSVYGATPKQVLQLLKSAIQKG